ncbi:MAG: alkaline phosphatase, partial [Patescibacteria group bacterium]|nr:alkaline phosphatase [Patescibacteria group bacterium]
SKLDVIMGAGHPWHGDDGKRQADAQGNPVPQKDGFDYVGGQDTWDALVAGKAPRGLTFIESRADFERLARGEGDVPRGVVGIAQAHTTIQYNRPGTAGQADEPLNENVPSLATIAQAAIHVLSQNPEGFVLMIEGGAVDWANHGNRFARMLDEQVDFNQAVAAVVEWIEANGGWDETLLIVTSDHDCGMLWGPNTYTDVDGDGRFNPKTDKFLGWKPVENRGKGQLPGYQYASGGHSNVFVPLWAKGPGAALFEQLVNGVDAKAGAFWGFDGRHVDNIDVFTVMRAALAPVILPSAPCLKTKSSAQPATAP